MPYIITTKRLMPHDAGARAHNSDDWPRTAVATLDEARHEAWGVVQGRNWMTDVSAYQAVSDEARALPTEGGTVGPLPDGTVIEVAPMGWHPDGLTDAEAVVAFNEAQTVSA